MHLGGFWFGGSALTSPAAHIGLKDGAEILLPKDSGQFANIVLPPLNGVYVLIIKSSYTTLNGVAEFPWHG